MKRKQQSTFRGTFSLIIKYINFKIVGKILKRKQFLASKNKFHDAGYHCIQNFKEVGATIKCAFKK